MHLFDDDDDDDDDDDGDDDNLKLDGDPFAGGFRNTN